MCPTPKAKTSDKYVVSAAASKFGNENEEAVIKNGGIKTTMQQTAEVLKTYLNHS